MAGEPATPLLAAPGIALKCEHLNPTGSFKDRIAARAFELGGGAGARGWIGASSGNAGVAFAAAAARHRLDGVLLTVESIAAPQLAHLSAFGPRIYAVAGFGRDPSVDAAVHARLRAIAVERRLVLGVTARTANEAAMEGIGVIADELVRQLPRPPGAVYMPTGGGGLVSSLAVAFRRLRAAGAIERLPRLVAVQAEGCRPICDAIEAGADTVRPASTSTTGIAAVSLTRPPDGDLALAAVRESDGFGLAIGDAEAEEAGARLAREAGTLVEPAAALAYAAFLRRPLDDAVAILTGSGLKNLAATAVEPPAKISVEELDRIDDSFRPAR